MLNDIRLHLDADEKAQSETERALATDINTLQSKNVKAFNQYVPSIGRVLSQLPFERLSVFVDKRKQINIVDFKSGMTLYGPHSDANIQAQVNGWAYHSALLDFSDNDAVPVLAKHVKTGGAFAAKQAYAGQLHAQTDSVPIDSLVVLGLGKAQHLSQLIYPNLYSQALNTSGLKHVVIYEPDWEVFRCSLSVFDWAELLAYAHNHKLQLFFQMGSDIHQLFDDISELHTQLSARRILFFKHINLPVYMQLIDCVQSGNWGRAVTHVSKQHKGHQYHHLHVFSAIEPANCQSVSIEDTLFQSNMALFKEYFPDIHDSFENYTPLCWEAFKDSAANTINMYNAHYGNFYANTQVAQESEQLAQHFMAHPNLDGLVFGYEGDKLRHYLHNTFIRQADMLLRENEESQGELPTHVKALMVFGLGNGYMLNNVYKHHTIGNLIICEPNPDFFYASLHAIDWAPIFEQVNEGEYKLYINIGEASSRLFKDLMSQFLVLGPHLLNETFIMQAYHNPLLHQVLCEVRQQLKVIFAMGENFDHVAYGIAHTVNAMQARTPALRHNPGQYLSTLNKQTPVFLVGNGPSLDQSIALIKEYAGAAIVVSCGTALQALYKNGITPDFHGEVEQNRANFDWASRINDRAYLKKITLLSVNGIHPDTSKLYKNVLIAFKSGESSSHSLLAMFGPNRYHCLDYAYPTVTNMAMSFFLSMGFEQLYLIGVDLGFADQSKHHSSASGYYENGKQIYDYQSVHAADLRVKGNRQEWVFTKTEFNISRMIIEQLLQDVKARPKYHLECFNLSDGVYIEGTLPLDPDAVLVVANQAQKQATLAALDNCFMSVSSNVLDMLEQAYQSKLLKQQFAELQTISAASLSSKEDIANTIESLSALLKTAKRQGKSLFFYYFFNSINYLSAALSKASLQSNSSLATLCSQRLMQNWQVFLSDANDMLTTPFSLIDTAEAFGDKREAFLLAATPTVHFFSRNHITLNAMSHHLASQGNTGLRLFDDVEKLSAQIGKQAHADAVMLEVNNIDDMALYATLLKPWGKVNGTELASDNSGAPKIGLLFHDFALLQSVKQKYGALCDEACLVYCSALFDSVANDYADKISQGLKDILLVDEFCHVLQARAQDLTKYSLVLVKPRFSKAGLLNANAFNRNSTSPISDYLFSSSMIKNLELAKVGKHSKAKKSLSLAKHSKADAVQKSVTNNEYESVSVAIVNQQLISKLPRGHNSYMFKQYFAYTKHTPEPHEAPLTILDTLENRGRLLKRAPLDFELMGVWHNVDTLN